MLAPGFADHRIFGIPRRAKTLQFGQGCVFGGRLVNGLEIGGDGLVVFPRDILERGAHHVHDTALDLGVGIYRLYRVWEAREAIHAGDEDIV